MLNPSIMQLKMELSEKEHKYSLKELKMKRLFWELQTLANPYYDSVSAIKADEIEQCAKEMKCIKSELLNLSKDISEIKSQLGV